MLIVTIAVIIPLAMFVVSILYFWSMSTFRALGFGTFGALDRATAAQEEGDLDLALYWANLAVKRNGHFQVTYHTRGRIREAMGKLTEAIEDYSQAMECSQGFGGYYVDRGRAYEKLGQLDAAVRDYCKEIIRNPNSKFGPQSWAEQRAERKGAGTLDEMIAVFDSAIEKNPTNKTFIKCRTILAKAKRFPRDDKSANIKKEKKKRGKNY